MLIHTIPPPGTARRRSLPTVVAYTAPSIATAIVMALALLPWSHGAANAGEFRRTLDPRTPAGVLLLERFLTRAEQLLDQAPPHTYNPPLRTALVPERLNDVRSPASSSKQATAPGYRAAAAGAAYSTSSTHAAGRANNLAQLSLAPYQGPFEVDEAAHLLRRATIGPGLDEIVAAVNAGLASTVETLLRPALAPPPPAPWAIEKLPDLSGWTPAEFDSLAAIYSDRMRIARLWWIDRMRERTSAPSSRELMVHFWHDHFATQASGVFLPQAMWVQNDLLRRYALGNVRDLCTEIYRNPAMLIFLDGNQNFAGNINENFARELLELFTMGLDRYTQEDIVEASRAFTGWVTPDGITAQFLPELHDHGDKTFLGQTGPWRGDDIIRIIFEQDETARFLARKLYRFLVAEAAPEPLIDEAAATLRDNDYEVRPLLRQLFLSEHFFDIDLRGAQVRDGVDFTAGLLRTLRVDTPELAHVYPAVVTDWLEFSQVQYGHLLFEPPDVNGWEGHLEWINSSTLPWRKKLSGAVVQGGLDGLDFEFEFGPLAWANTLSNPAAADQLVDDMALVLFGMRPTELVRQSLLDELLQGAEIYDWSLADPEAPERIRDLVNFALKLPDAQLK